ncbi:TPA: GPO family capsid scaffolding protein [Yersinia enterocolitica]|uniref:GPO family capsid scaffolding protein n=1 Tax=Yersinia enterocolitica TaxID=630 RepID=UPI0005E8D165|nr:GPO family capsid scaffolding protein [Yersinia enterocolitica]EKN4756426.1 GPO family capsid scaffolding protein [Yersinia enterocolitica]CQH45346.1 phage capsid scaffolding protein [Yersinia enterocolitica]CQI01810.1 phage capsid scaffolding protein [Yersinia enterocolitica]CRY18974.1 phage capsid scaffolding protein [Yersinia enterocolitica]HDL6905966.1 GPO family capsid scaffolding protein [Yersinia enterocolitica]
MAKKVSKWFRIGVEGDTCDGRDIDGNDIQQMADSFDPRVYGARINLEHIKGLYPDGDFKRLGDVVALKAEKIEDNSILNGKLALFAKLTPTEPLADMVAASQKIYTSMEIRRNFANTGKAYLVGLAVTDDPASLGTEVLAFSAKAKVNPFAGKKDHPDDLFSVATLAELEFEDAPDTLLNSLTDKVKNIFSRKQASDDARFHDVHEAVTAVSEQLQSNGESVEQRFAALEQKLQLLTEQASADQQALSTLKGQLGNSESFSQQRRPQANGGNGEEMHLTNC